MSLPKTMKLRAVMLVFAVAMMAALAYGMHAVVVFDPEAYAERAFEDWTDGLDRHASIQRANSLRASLHRGQRPCMRDYHGALPLSDVEVERLGQALWPHGEERAFMDRRLIALAFEAWNAESEQQHHERLEHEEVLQTILESAPLRVRIAAPFHKQALAAAFRDAYGHRDDVLSELGSAIRPSDLAHLRHVWETHRAVATGPGVRAAPFLVAPP